MSEIAWGYARVSTADGRQVLDRQTDALRVAGIEPQHLVTDRVSGTKASRPGLGTLMLQLRRGDSVTVLSLDRASRDLRQLLAWTDALEAAGVTLRILQLQIDTAAPTGRLMLQVVGAVAELEAAALRVRVREGLAAAKARGRVGGRPASLTNPQRREVEKLIGEGRPSGEIAALFGVSARTVRRVAAALR